MGERREPPTIIELIEHHYQLVYRYAFRLSGSVAEAEDLTQETFLIAQEKGHQLRDPGNAKGWLCTIVRHEFFRQRKRQQIVEIHPLESVAEPTELLTDTKIDEEKLQNGLNQLTEEFRTPLILYYFREMSYKEIAAAMDTPIGTIMSRLARAKSYLKRHLADSDAMMTSAEKPQSFPPHDEREQ